MAPGNRHRLCWRSCACPPFNLKLLRTVTCRMWLLCRASKWRGVPFDELLGKGGPPAAAALSEKWWSSVSSMPTETTSTLPCYCGSHAHLWRQGARFASGMVLQRISPTHRLLECSALWLRSPPVSAKRGLGSHVMVKNGGWGASDLFAVPAALDDRGVDAQTRKLPTSQL